MASRLQHHLNTHAWQPSQAQIQRRAFPISSRGGMDNHPNNADYHANTGYEFLNSAADRSNVNKLYNFPTDPKLPLSSYPDVTKDLEVLRDKIVQQIKPYIPHPVTLFSVAPFYWQFAPRQVWDTKSLPNFPGNVGGKDQLALYKGHIVTAAYVANNLYGQVSAKIYLPLTEALKGGDIGAQTGGLFHFKYILRDQPEDQWAIHSGYYDAQGKSPWFETQSNYYHANVKDLSY